MDGSERGKAEGASERVEDGQASTKASNGDGEQETGEEADAATCRDGTHEAGQDEFDPESEEDAPEHGENPSKRRYNRFFFTVLCRVVIYSFSCTLFILNR
jgi:hypothetical protein